MKILVTGVSGQLGYDVERELDRRGIEHLGTSSRELDITDREAVERLMESYRPDAVIHCAAYTKVDLAQDEPERCWAVNADGTRNMAAACRKTGAKLLYMACMFMGRVGPVSLAISLTAKPDDNKRKIMPVGHINVG